MSNDEKKEDTVKLSCYLDKKSYDEAKKKLKILDYLYLPT